MAPRKQNGFHKIEFIYVIVEFNTDFFRVEDVLQNALLKVGRVSYNGNYS